MDLHNKELAKRKHLRKISPAGIPASWRHFSGRDGATHRLSMKAPPSVLSSDRPTKFKSPQFLLLNRIIHSISNHLPNSISILPRGQKYNSFQMPRAPCFFGLSSHREERLRLQWPSLCIIKTIMVTHKYKAASPSSPIKDENTEPGSSAVKQPVLRAPTVLCVFHNSRNKYESNYKAEYIHPVTYANNFQDISIYLRL